MKDKNYIIRSVVTEKALTRFNILFLDTAFNKPPFKGVIYIIFVWLYHHKCASLT